MQLEKSPLTKEKALDNIRCYNENIITKKHKQYLEVMTLLEKETRNGKSELQFVYGKFNMIDLDPEYLKEQLRLHHEGFTYSTEKGHSYTCECSSNDATCTNWHIIRL